MKGSWMRWGKCSFAALAVASVSLLAAGSALGSSITWTLGSAYTAQGATITGWITTTPSSIPGIPVDMTDFDIQVGGFFNSPLDYVEPQEFTPTGPGMLDDGWTAGQFTFDAGTAPCGDLSCAQTTNSLILKLDASLLTTPGLVNLLPGSAYSYPQLVGSGTTAVTGFLYAQGTPQTTPEPGTWVLLASGALLLAGLAWRRGAALGLPQ